MAKHDERNDVRLLSRIVRITNDKTIKADKNSVIGIHAWGKIDYLTKHCGYVLVWESRNNSGRKGEDSDKPETERKNKKAIRKETKDNFRKKRQ